MKDLKKWKGFPALAAGLTVAFGLLCGSWFLLSAQPEPWAVSSDRSDAAETEAADAAEYPAALLPGEKISLNSAPAKDLERVPQLGEKRSQAIVAFREEHGPFSSLEELVLVPGIGEGILKQVYPYIALD